eukprot:6186115-Pleurochrysis_carterae.AAC.2
MIVRHQYGKLRFRASRVCLHSLRQPNKRRGRNGAGPRRRNERHEQVRLPDIFRGPSIPPLQCGNRYKPTCKESELGLRIRNVSTVVNRAMPSKCCKRRQPVSSDLLPPNKQKL